VANDASEDLLSSPVIANATMLVEQWGLGEGGSRNTGVAAPMICVVGAGGKSTTTFAIAHALARTGRRTIVTTTTKMGHDQTGGLPATSPDIATIRAAFATASYPLLRVVTHKDLNSPKVVGPPITWLDELAVSGEVDAIVIEADGARRKNVKAPGPMEPVFPSLCTHIIAVLGSESLDRVIEDQGHRPMRIAAAAGCAPYDRLTASRAAKLLVSELGGRKGHTGSRIWTALVTQVTDTTRENADAVVASVRAFGFDAFCVDHDPQAKELVRPTDHTPSRD
jgi:probable selenium-dependent hydroxylase accessory protein YqeC